MNTDTSDSESRDAGFSMIEIVVSMFMIALLAIAFLPLLIQGVKQSAASATLATATQLVQQQMESVRGVTTCAALSSAALVPTTLSSSLTDRRGVTLGVAKVVGACPITSLVTVGLVSVSSTVKRGTTVLATASTYVYVNGL